MVAPAPIGAPAGFLEVSLRCGCISIADSETSQAEQFPDLQSAARALFHLVVKRFIAARPDLLWIHAGVVAYASRALLFSAASGQGKSTLVAELLARGWGYLSDEIAPVDPVSGNAHAMLAAYLWDLGQFGKNSTTFIGRQGRQMKRPGQVNVKLEVDQGSLVAAHIGGTAVIVSEGTLAL